MACRIKARILLKLRINRLSNLQRAQGKTATIAFVFLALSFVATPAALMLRLLDSWSDPSRVYQHAYAAPVAPVWKTAPSALVTPQDVRAAATVAKVKFVFANAGYSLDAVRRGWASVPRIQHDYLPYDLAGIDQAEERKAFFLHFMLPYVLEANDRVMAQRTNLIRLAATLKAGAPLTGDDVEWLAKLGREYNVQPDNLEKLLVRVDVIPPSLALAQGAVESGWGTSRFAQEGNAPFGQWTSDQYQGLVPRERSAGKTHKVRAFESIGASVDSYLRNLNTHRAYRGFRESRASFRARNVPMESLHLATALGSYSEKGDYYVKLLRQIIRGNDLSALDQARLGAEVVVFHPDA